MGQNVLVLDLETKKSFDQVGGRDHLAALGVSVVGVYSYRQREYHSYFEADFPKLLALLAEKPLVIGFNHRRFDMPVLQPYFKEIDLSKLPMLDILEELHRTLGHRVSLDSVAKATLGTQKSGHGLDAIKYWNNGELDKLKKYCLDDVRITKEVYEYGAKNKELQFFDRYGVNKMKVTVGWKWHDEEPAQEQLGLF